VAGGSCVADVPGGSCDLEVPNYNLGTSQTGTATYSGDDYYAPSTGTATDAELPYRLPTTTTIGSIGLSDGTSPIGPPIGEPAPLEVGKPLVVQVAVDWASCPSGAYDECDQLSGDVLVSDGLDQCTAAILNYLDGDAGECVLSEYDPAYPLITANYGGGESTYIPLVGETQTLPSTANAQLDSNLHDIAEGTDDVVSVDTSSGQTVTATTTGTGSVTLGQYKIGPPGELAPLASTGYLDIKVASGAGRCHSVVATGLVLTEGVRGWRGGC
jgi:hypothetical protein